jgi:hypothetical protein
LEEAPPKVLLILRNVPVFRPLGEAGGIDDSAECAYCRRSRANAHAAAAEAATVTVAECRRDERTICLCNLVSRSPSCFGGLLSRVFAAMKLPEKASKTATERCRLISDLGAVCVTTKHAFASTVLSVNKTKSSSTGHHTRRSFATKPFWILQLTLQLLFKS